MLPSGTAEPIELPEINEALPALLRRLVEVRSDDPRIVTTYLGLRVDDREGRGFLIELKDAMRAVRLTPGYLTLGHTGREEVERDLERILRWVESAAPTWPTPALALYAWEAGGIFEAAPLSRVPATRVSLDRIPRLLELVVGVSAARPVFAVLLDRTHARLFEVTSFAVTEQPGVFAATTRGGKFHSQRGDAPGWGERNFHGRLDEERRRQHAVLIEAIRPSVRSAAPQGLLLAGPKDRTAAFRAALPEDLGALVIGESALNPTSASAAEVRAAALGAAEAARAERLTELVRSIQDGVGRGLAVEGINETLRALSRGQVRTLAIPEDRAGEGYRCTDTGRLVVSRDQCRGEGEPVPIASVLEEVVEDALRSGVELVSLPPGNGGELLDGIGALLRYRSGTA